MKKISVIIPAYNEEHSLPKALSALSRQDFPRDDFEIIVVDNNSTDATADVARRWGADAVIFEHTAGTNQARKTGLAHASGEIVAFLDADCTPPREWVSRINEFFASAPKGVAAVAGPYNFDAEHYAVYLVQDMYWRILFPSLSFVVGRVLNRGGAMLGGNFAAPKTSFEKADPIDPSYAFFGDDAAIARNFGKVGWVQFDNSLGVDSSSRRFKRDGFWKTQWRYAKSYVQVMMK